MGMSRIYLDSCIVIYFVEKHPTYAAVIETAIDGLSEKDTLCFSPLTRMECLIKPLRETDEVLEGHFEAFFGAQQILDITPNLFKNAARLRADFTSLKTPDAIHLATAQHYGCDEFWTNDNRLDKVAGSLVKNVLAP
jgi:uncharacterized protein